MESLGTSLLQRVYHRTSLCKMLHQPLNVNQTGQVIKAGGSAITRSCSIPPSSSPLLFPFYSLFHKSNQSSPSDCLATQFQLLPSSLPLYNPPPHSVYPSLFPTPTLCPAPVLQHYPASAHSIPSSLLPPLPLSVPVTSHKCPRHGHPQDPTSNGAKNTECNDTCQKKECISTQNLPSFHRQDV